MYFHLPFLNRSMIRSCRHCIPVYVPSGRSNSVGQSDSRTKGAVPTVRDSRALLSFLLPLICRLVDLFFESIILLVSSRVLYTDMSLIFLQVLALLFLSLHHVYIYTSCARPSCHTYVESTETVHINVSTSLLVASATPIPLEVAYDTQPGAAHANYAHTIDRAKNDGKTIASLPVRDGADLS